MKFFQILQVYVFSGRQYFNFVILEVELLEFQYFLVHQGAYPRELAPCAAQHSEGGQVFEHFRVQVPDWVAAQVKGFKGGEQEEHPGGEAPQPVVGYGEHLQLLQGHERGRRYRVDVVVVEV